MESNIQHSPLSSVLSIWHLATRRGLSCPPSEAPPPSKSASNCAGELEREAERERGLTPPPFLSGEGGREDGRANAASSLPWPSLLDCELPPLPPRERESLLSLLPLRERESPLLLLPLHEREPSLPTSPSSCGSAIGGSGERGYGTASRPSRPPPSCGGRVGLANCRSSSS